MEKFNISSEDSEILLQLESAISLREISSVLLKDASVISRRLQALSKTTPFLWKDERQWKLTTQGIRFNDWTRRAMVEQRSILNSTDKIRIATTREFGAKVLCRSVEWFSSLAAQVEVITTDEGIEGLLLNAQADFGFDCGNPYSPQVGFKKGIKEAFALVHSPALKVRTFEALSSHPLYHCNRIELSFIQRSLDLKSLLPPLTFNDLSMTREALINGKGWSLLPRYCVQEEIHSGRLSEVDHRSKIPATHFGLWWNKQNAPRKDVLNHAFQWLARQEL